MEQSPYWEANRSSGSQEIPLLYGTWMFITAFTSARHLSPYPKADQPSPRLPIPQTEDPF
jgi:hypothetical protein